MDCSRAGTESTAQFCQQRQQQRLGSVGARCCAELSDYISDVPTMLLTRKDSHLRFCVATSTWAALALEERLITGAPNSNNKSVAPHTTHMIQTQHFRDFYTVQ